MSTANIWPDDSDVSLSTQHHPAGQHAAGLSPMAQGPYFYDAWNLETDDPRPTELDMDLDAETFAAPVTGNANLSHIYSLPYHMDDDDDDDDDDYFNETAAQDDIMAVTNVLSQDMATSGTTTLTEVTEDHPFAPPQPFAGFSFAPPLQGLQFDDHHMVSYPPSPAGVPLGLPSLAAFGAAHVAMYQNGLNANGANTLQDAASLHQHLAPLAHPQLLHPNALSNPHGNALGPDNPPLDAFVEQWAIQSPQISRGWSRNSRGRPRNKYPWLKKIDPQMSKPVARVDYMDLDGDRCDVQGIDWHDMGVTRSDARERRSLVYKNYVNVAGSDRWQENHDVLPCTEDYFRFRRLHVRKNINLVHFQLRNVLASTSRSQTFYPGANSVYELNPITGKGKVGMRSRETPNLQVSTLAAAHGVLVAGGFFGEYCYRQTDSQCSGDVHEGTITTDASGITNHVQVHLSRSSAGPRACFASNDNHFRVLDLTTDKFVAETRYGNAVNCTAVSPDLRLRVVVGDQKEVMITKAEPDGKPEILHSLEGHGDFGFSCAWADDGWTVATGNQDKAVKIWDARRWTDAQGRAAPVCTLRSEIASCRSLKFSPLGSGQRVLVAAEESDFVSIYDAVTWQSKQTFDMFGEIGGTAFVNEGRDLQILCTDRTRGGIFQLERCGMGAERSHSPERTLNWKNGSYDWPEFSTTPRALPRHSETHRRRRALVVESIDPF